MVDSARHPLQHLMDPAPPTCDTRIESVLDILALASKTLLGIHMIIGSDQSLYQLCYSEFDMSEQGREWCAGRETRKIIGRYDLISVVSGTKHGFSRNRMEQTGMPSLQHITNSRTTSDIHSSESEARKCCFTPSIRNDRFSVSFLSSFDGTFSLVSIIVQQEGARPL
jgi:hypothetical protein